MKKNNKKVIQLFKMLNLAIVILIILNLIMYTGVLPHKYHIIPPYVVTIFIALLIYVSYKSGNQFFAMDTKGETITFETKNVGFLSFLDSKTNKIDLPKYKLIKYEFQKGILSKSIVFYIDSKKNPTNLIKVKFRLAFISNRNINIILTELDKIVESNYVVKDNVEVAI
ncbi:hypothetical protein ACTS91_05500 [Empedobacter falsenii]|jgi:hypothetical protein|uniref:Uncharacterized protein n=1 Tax=Empedobacter falsenii TaxID=343874 RepID=A0A376FXQ3_9FLAO|nr:MULTISPECIES: hypothetical protein [Empedobacter]MDH1882638.1 hypothetical protein [Empedobacter sp. GD03797]MDM1040915.1 hypothetical protein [Empedobacter brevis]MDM1134496.1 hypothetical protein [Empedobacter sp. R750]STD53125.1 Uncharacterised protein [Empedobacter falsenii]